jgi:hypothetical protein
MNVSVGSPVYVLELDETEARWLGLVLACEEPGGFLHDQLPEAIRPVLPVNDALNETELFRELRSRAGW